MTNKIVIEGIEYRYRARFVYENPLGPWEIFGEWINIDDSIDMELPMRPNSEYTIFPMRVEFQLINEFNESPKLDGIKKHKNKNYARGRARNG